jgi:predicted N-acyltransferase
MTYSFRLFNSLAEVDLAAWEHVRNQSGASIVLDPRFLGAVESSMLQNCRLWYVLVYEDDTRAVGCAVMTGITMDLANFVDPGTARLIRALPRRLMPLRDLKLMICGLPIPTGHPLLGVAQRDTSPRIVPVIDKAISEVSARMKMNAVVYREFGQEDLQWTSPLLDLGYQRLKSEPAFFFKPQFRDLEHYCAALKSHYRKQVKRSLRKLELKGVQTKVLASAGEILKVYTPEVHGLFHQMRDRAEVKFDEIPIDFLRELASRMGSAVNLILFAIDSRIIAFGWCLHSPSAYSMLYAGLDYALNDELDLYFNLHYAALDCALRKQVSTIELGATAGAFKARLGCYSQPSYFFVRGLTPLISLLLRYGGNLLVPKQPAPPAFEVFSSAEKSIPERQ